MAEILLSRQRSALLVIDFQEKLAAHVQARERTEANIARLVRAAGLLEIPVIVTEQYPRGLGPTTAGLRPLLPAPYEKLAFGCCKEASVAEALAEVDRDQWVLAGIETHVCVLQTAAQLVQQRSISGVFVVADACSARRQYDHDVALARLRQAGIQVVTTESVLFEWLERAGTEKFKRIAALVKATDSEVLADTLGPSSASS